MEKGEALKLCQVSTLFEFILSAMEKRLRKTRNNIEKKRTLPDPVAMWDFTSANRFQLGFLHAAQDNLRSTLALIGIGFGVDLVKKSVMLVNKNKPTSSKDKLLRISDVRRALSDLEKFTEKHLTCDYQHIMHTVKQGAAKVLGSRLAIREGGKGKLLGEDEGQDQNNDDPVVLGSVRDFILGIESVCLKVDAKGGSFRRQSEMRLEVIPVAEQKNEEEPSQDLDKKRNSGIIEGDVPSKSGVRVRLVYMDVDSLGEEQRKLLMQYHRCETQGKLKRKLVYYHVMMTCREILRSIQTYANQHDTQKFAWCSEHNASYSAGSLFLMLCKERPVRDLFPAGFSFEVVSLWLQDSLKSFYSWPSDTKSEYLRWRDSYGTYTPSLLGVTANPKVSSEFKKVMCIESCFNSSWALQMQLNFLFHDRARNLRSFKIAGIPLPIRHRKGSRLPLLNIPVAVTGSARDAECCEAPSTTVCYASTV